MVITRFAPSPTGDLHVGSARTALYSYLYAKHHQGQYILRIEDTDQERSTQAAVDVILNGLAWLGIQSQQPPEYQSQRLHRYNEVVQQLLANGQAYRCYLSKAELDAMREAQIEQKQKPRYNNHSRELNLSDTGEPHVIRFKNPLTGNVVFTDEILGEISIDNLELDDFILIRSDGMPTYNFAVVVDDSDMGITHVIRGNDHLNNTVRQINVYKALHLTIPKFAHIPMIAGSDGKKLSKRHGAVSVLQYRDEGYLPEALINYLVRLGWSHGDQEIFSMQEMVANFNFAAVSKSQAIFDYEKLQWLNQHYIKTLPWETLAPHIIHFFGLENIDVNQGPDLQSVVDAYRERAVTLAELATKTRCYFQPDVDYDADAAASFLTSPSIPILQCLIEQLTQLSDWQSETLQATVKQVVKAMDVKFPMVGQPLRVALTGNTQSPGIADTLVLTGRERTLSRLNKALSYIEDSIT